MSRKVLQFFTLLILSVLTVLGIGVFASYGYPSWKTSLSFNELPTPLSATYDLFDLGVANINNDNLLDIFTLNHSARQDVLVAIGSGEYTEVLEQLHLSQDRNFPQLEDVDVSPDIERAGLYIYRQNFDLLIRTHKLDPTDTVKGTLTVALPVTVKEQTNAEVKVLTDETTKVKFSLEGNGTIVLKGFPGIHHHFDIDERIALKQIYVGHQMLHPASYSFDLLWRDRHTMAWADINNDGQNDVFIGRGGIRGKLKELDLPIKDELFLAQSEEFSDRAESLGLEKAGCPVRQSAWVDYNRDDRLDLYVVCGRVGDDTPFPNQLYQQQASGRFVDVATSVGLDLPLAGYFSWVDSDNDGDLDLLATQGKQLQLYVNEAERFKPQANSLELDGSIDKIAINDFDLDGDYDAYIVTKKKNVLLENKQGSYVRVNPLELGLPDEGITANWVDYDNDALSDLHVIPHGLYRQEPNGNFKHSQLLDLRLPKFDTWNARAIWFDANNDGTRDLLIAFQQTPSVLQRSPSLWKRLKNQLLKHDTSKLWQSRFYQNTSADKNHWLAIELVGNSGNTPAIGAKVILKQKERTQVQQVGINENSHYSQGHYRLYYGLGKNSEVESLEIVWNDGDRQVIKFPLTDRLLTIRQST